MKLNEPGWSTQKGKIPGRRLSMKNYLLIQLWFCVWWNAWSVWKNVSMTVTYIRFCSFRNIIFFILFFIYNSPLWLQMPQTCRLGKNCGMIVMCMVFCFFRNILIINRFLFVCFFFSVVAHTSADSGKVLARQQHV